MSKIQNIDVKFNASSNFGKVKADLTALRAQAAALGNVFEKNAYAKPPAVVDPATWQKSTRAVHDASNVYRNAVSSSGLLTSQQIRATDAAEQYTQSLQKQKLTFGEMRKHSGIMKQVYADQLRYQRMTAQSWGSDSAGRGITDITIPKNVPRDLDTVAQKIYFAGQMAKSSGTQIVNMGKNMQWAGRQLMVGFTYPVALFGAAAGVMAYKVDEAMTQVTKVYDVSAKAQQSETLRVQELNDVRARSWEMASQNAKNYGQSIENTLAVESALAATGLAGNKLFESTDAVSRIATLGDLDLTASTDMTIALQTAFKETIKTTDDLNKSFDFMNAVENATSLSIKDIAEATPRAASSMAALGVSVEEMTVLLTAMREAGVNAAEGANALKSATGTILAPSPAAINFIEELGGEKLANGMANLRDSTGGNLYKAIKEIYDMTRDLSSSDRQAVIVKMFGKYQFNRVSGLVENLGAAFDGTENQAKKAMDLMGEESEELASRSERELGEKMEAVSGRFTAAWANMRIELAKIGEPFLKVATIAANVATDVLAFFNGMSDWKKKAALGIAAVMAIAGPVVMLGGLFMNLGGQFIKGGGRLMSVWGRLGGAVALVTKEEQMATLATEQQNKAMAAQTSHVSTLIQEIRVLTAAYAKATEAAIGLPRSMGGPFSPAALPKGHVPQSAPWSSPIGPQLPVASYSYPRNQSGNAGVIASSKRSAEVAEMRRQQAQVGMNQKAAAELALREKIRGSISGAAIGTGVMAASMAAMMLPLGETTNQIAKWAMIGTIAAPALQMMVSGGNKLLGGLGKAVTSARAASMGMSAMGTAMHTAKLGAIGFGTALNAALGPIGWIALGLTAIVGTYLAVKNHNDKIAAKQKAIVDEQIKATKVMQSSTASIATSLGKAAGSYKQIVDAGGAASSGNGSESQMLEAFNRYKSEEGMEETKALQSDGKLIATDELIDKVRGKYIDLQVVGKDTAEQAKIDIQAMLLAAGASSIQAASLAEDVYNKYGDINKMDWAKPIEDQAAALDSLARDAFSLSTERVGSGMVPRYAINFEIDKSARDKLYVQAEKSAQIFTEALGSAANPAEEMKIIDQYMAAATSQWQSGFETLVASDIRGSDKVRELFEQFSIESGKAFADAMRNNSDFEEAYLNLAKNPTVTTELQGQLTYLREFAGEYENAFIVPLAEASGNLGESVMTAVDALKEFAEGGIGLTAKEAAKALVEGNDAYKEYAEIQRQLAVYENSNSSGFDTSTRLLLQERLLVSGKKLTKVINELNQEYGFKQGRNATEALKYLMGEVAKESKDAEDKVKGVDKALDGMDTQKTVRINLTQVGGIVQSAMSNVQSSMADSAMNKFNSDWDGRMEGAQASWDSRMEGMTASHDAAQNAMDNRQQDAQDAFDRRWEARKEAVQKEYERKIDRVNKEIESEQKADQIRQQLFEKEKARLASLAGNANTDIDFNTQLNEGNLDEAAKTLNNAGVAAANEQMEAEQAAAEKRSEAKIASLEKKNERLEKARDKEVKNLEKLEARMRKHLERVQEARSRALEKQQADEVKALEKSEAASMKSMEKLRDYDEAMLEQSLELFKSYTARNQKDLERWMKEVGLGYNKFGKDVKAKGEDWSKHFRTELNEQIKLAGTKVMNDSLWEKVGEGMANKLLKGLGFANIQQFNKFVRTGSKGSGGGKKGDAGGVGAGAGVGVETRHEGGMIGSGTGSRKGVPNTYKGLHRSEQMVRAQKGEYVINRKASSQHRDTLDSINSGNYDKDGNRIYGTGGGDAGYGGPAGLLAGAISQMFQKGVEKSFQNNYQRGLAKQRARQSAGGSYGSAKEGKYGDSVFNSEQLKNAAIIASTASGLGASQRDIQIALMTAMQESTLRNLDWGDRDSVGLFQQRDAWGSFASRTNPVASTKMFFNGGAAGQRGLFDFPDRGSMSLAEAAQAVQVSAYPDAYAKWANEASAIMGAMKKSGGGVSGPGGSKGFGKYWRASDPGKGWRNGHDYANAMRSPVYAIGPGNVRTAQLSPSAGSGQHPDASPRGYGSYGVVSYLTTDDGQRVTYAHLYPGTQASGRVEGGQRIALSASTGNSSGPHTHFEVNGSGTVGDAAGRFAAMGIPLRTGGTIKYDNTPASLHKGETVLTASLTQKFKDNVASGGGDQYTINVDLRGSYIKEDVDIEKAVNTAIDKRETKVGRKRVIR